MKTYILPDFTDFRPAFDLNLADVPAMKVPPSFAHFAKGEKNAGNSSTPGVYNRLQHGEIRNIAGNERQRMDFRPRRHESIHRAHGATTGLATGDRFPPRLGKHDDRPPESAPAKRSGMFLSSLGNNRQ